MTNDSASFLALSQEVAESQQQGQPIVVVESSIVSPAGEFPGNVAVLAELSDALRACGVVPAVVTVMNGQIRVGLETSDLERFARAKSVAKIGRRDLATALARGEYASTTVSSALYCTHLAGLPLVMTGAIGGVHRNYETTLDASADLEELAATPVAVVCAGAKVILDLPRTLEYLETKGVPVIGYRTSDFPAYFCPSGLPVDARMESAAEIAQVMRTHWSLGMKGSLVIAVAPSGEIATDRGEIELHVRNALAEANQKGIAGKAITPFLLKHLEQATGGMSERIRRSSLLLVAEAAAEIAVQYSNLMQSRAGRPTSRRASAGRP